MPPAYSFASGDAMRPSFIAGDWGGSHLRLYLCNHAQVLDEQPGPGIAAIHAQQLAHDTVLFEAIRPWREAHGALPIVMAGMVGSRNGWVEVPYADCPADANTLRAALHRFEAMGHTVAIAPGLACTNTLDAPDVMRGEESQVIGVLAVDPVMGHGRRVIVLPGTHCKWVMVENGRIIGFQTSFVGELFDLLRRHSLLLGADDDAGHDHAAFALGLQRANTATSLPHVLFETRSRQLREGMSTVAAASFLSGLIIGADIRGALNLLRWQPDTLEVGVVATPELSALYTAALHHQGYATRTHDGAQCVLAGLRVLGAEN